MQNTPPQFSRTRILPPESIVPETDAADMQPEFLQRGGPNRPVYLPRMAEPPVAMRNLPRAKLRA